MVIGAFPIAKLGALLLKQLSKPIANVVKERAKTHPFFRRYICMPPAQFYNWCEIRMRMWMLNLGKPVNTPPMNEAMAIELGANLVGETVIFGIAAAILLFEYNRQSSSNERKEQMLKDDLEGLKYSLQELSLREEQHKTEIKELYRIVYDIDSKVVKKHAGPNLKNLNDPELTPSQNSAMKGTVDEALTYIVSTVQKPRATVP